MENIDIYKLKEIQLNILKEFANFCEENDINYWLDSGTLIGAVRHKGYIPWDDDIDVGMLRPDYDKFAQIYNENRKNTRYIFKSYEIDNDFSFPHGKMLDTKTVLNEPDIKMSVNIDVFVYDNAPDNNKEVYKMYKRRDIYRKLHSAQILKHKPKGNIIRRVIGYILHYVLRNFEKNYFCKKMVNNSKKYANDKTLRVGNFTSFTKFTCDKKVFDSFIDGEFEGCIFKIPVGYDEWLTEYYGDYMTLPPLEKRVSHHEFKAYMLE